MKIMQENRECYKVPAYEDVQPIPQTVVRLEWSPTEIRNGRYLAIELLFLPTQLLSLKETKLL